MWKTRMKRLECRCRQYPLPSFSCIMHGLLASSQGSTYWINPDRFAHDSSVSTLTITKDGVHTTLLLMLEKIDFTITKDISRN